MVVVEFCDHPPAIGAAWRFLASAGRRSLSQVTGLPLAVLRHGTAAASPPPHTHTAARIPYAYRDTHH